MCKVFKCLSLTVLIISPVAFGAGTTSITAPTHARLVCELAELESVGYDPQEHNSTPYPQNIQRAMRLAEQKRMAEGYQYPSTCS
jgi:hypothetical protein